MFHTWKSFLSESGTYAAADRKPHSFLSAFSGKGKRIIFQAVPRFLQAEYSRRCLPASGYSGFIVLHKQIHDIFQARLAQRRILAPCFRPGSHKERELFHQRGAAALGQLRGLYPPPAGGTGNPVWENRLSVAGRRMGK